MSYNFSVNDYKKIVDAHATIKVDGVKLNEGGHFINFGSTIELTASTGYEFYVQDGNASANFTKLSPGPVTTYVSFTISADGSTATLVLADPAPGMYQALNVATRVKVVTLLYTITQADIDSLNAIPAEMRINNVRASVGSKINSGQTVEITITALDKLFGDGNVYFTRTSGNVNFNIIQGGLKANLLTSGSEVYTGFHCVAGGALLYTFVQDDIDSLIKNNVTLKINNVIAAVGSKVNDGDSLDAVTSADRVFIVNAANEPSIYFRTVVGDVPFILRGDKDNHATLIAKPDQTIYAYDSFTCITKQIDSVSGANNVYLVDNKDIIKLNEERFVDVRPDATSVEIVDYGNYILGLILLPFKLPDGYLLEDEKITLGNFATSIEVPKVSEDNILIDLGDINVPATNGNLLDFYNVTSIIHLPFLSPIVLDNEYVIGEKINIKYNIDCYSGLATINISSSKINDVILTTKADIGINIPYINMESNSANNDNIRIGGNNFVRIPFIEVVQNDILMKDGFFNIPIIDEQILNTQNGYIRVESIKLRSSALKSEKDDIISILNNGVIIK